MSPTGHKRSWKNYLLNIRYQLTFTLILVAVATVLMAGLGAVVMGRVRVATAISIQQVQSSADMIGDPLAEVRLLRAREDMILLSLVLVGVGLAFGLFLYGIKMTHRVAGPLWKIGRYLDDVKAGRLGAIYGLRKGDELMDLFEHFREAHDALVRRQTSDIARLRRVVETCERAGVDGRSPEVAARLAELRALLGAKEASLG